MKTTEELCEIPGKLQKNCVKCFNPQKNCVKPHPKKLPAPPHIYIMGDIYRPKILGLLTIKILRNKKGASLV